MSIHFDQFHFKVFIPLNNVHFDTKYEMQLHSFSIYSSIQSQNVRRECLGQQTFITKLCNWIRLLFSVFYTYVCPFRPAMDYPKNVRRLNVCRPKLCFFLFHFFRSQYLTVCLSWPLIYVTAHFCSAKIQETGSVWKFCIKTV